ncbi:LysR family transcriptional regulator [Billgrantia tianxiuensis]|jgi:DNA-binding transcriptional LysR family regulator|uniref:LysR family transcriptional regulator n=1 Tax=Billgrantia tianxiuensis TaxID=2497861 RepID=A0A6I6SJB9_9GAMM|nr:MULTISPECIES: LysR family transcriptional regulator [Halomonas]MCE8034961.1 LysR family transcriptional regulator [Halomonas sp. MCCC 1A11057]QHC48524.1 LysR family transcriptional regulator [Halomonas tianxiuensis]
MQPDFNALLTFALVVETGNFTRAAERLGVSKSVVTRRISALEASLNVRLFNRTTHHVMPTDIAVAFHERARRVLDDLDEAVEAVTMASDAPRGLVRIAAPLAFTTMHLMPAIEELLEQYPRFEVQIEQDDRYLDLVAEGFDMAVRIGELKDSSLIARRLAPIRRLVVCSPEYARRHGTPATPRDLLDHDCLIYTNATPAEQWRFLIDGKWESIRATGRFKGNNARMLCDAALRGFGLAALPTFVAGKEIDRGNLEAVLLDYPLRESTLYAVYPPTRRLAAKVRTVVDFLAERFSDQPYWEPQLANPNET